MEIVRFKRAIAVISFCVASQCSSNLCCKLLCSLLYPLCPENISKGVLFQSLGWACPFATQKQHRQCCNRTTQLRFCISEKGSEYKKMRIWETVDEAHKGTSVSHRDIAASPDKRPLLRWCTKALFYLRVKWKLMQSHRARESQRVSLTEQHLAVLGDSNVSVWLGRNKQFLGIVGGHLLGMVFNSCRQQRKGRLLVPKWIIRVLTKIYLPSFEWWNK